VGYLVVPRSVKSPDSELGKLRTAVVGDAKVRDISELQGEHSAFIWPQLS
jgi:hypothetical protein